VLGFCWVKVYIYGYFNGLRVKGYVKYLASKIYRVGQKRGHKLITIILSNFNRFTIFFTRRFLDKFAVKYILEIPPHLAYVATLPCGTLMSAKQATNDKLQGSVAAYLRCGEVVNKQIKKHLLLSLRVQKNLKSVNI